ncbi:CgeB family protein [Bacillus massilinigeriensis]|uniref:CgeB family protein n=1 Tax=Bacillus mediterraneensis TaxID=1805474 RepID=UPI0008F82BF5|nr:glycosyltransferase [Bacillus mediterraneensis]
MKILFTNPPPIIKYGMQAGFKKNGWITDRLEVPEQSEEGLIKKIEEFKPDYLFTEGGVDTKKFVFPVLEKYSIPHIYWAIEDPVANSSLAMEWARKSELTLTPCIEMLRNYKEENITAICIPFAIDPDYYHKKPFKKNFADLDAVHIGNNYDVFDERYNAYNYILKPFIDKQKKIEIYGMDWQNPNHRFFVPDPYAKGYIAHEESVYAYSSTKITLGVHSIENSLTMQSMRTFEVLGCCGFFLTQRTKAIEAMFVNHEHLVSSGSYEETVELMNFYLANHSARERIAINGQKHVYNYHTYEQRAKEIIKEL